MLFTSHLKLIRIKIKVETRTHFKKTGRILKSLMSKRKVYIQKCLKNLI